MYNNPSCAGMEEFEEDLLRLKYTKRLLHRYVRNKEIPVRLLLNHIIGIYNVFQPHSISRLLFFRIDPAAYSALKTLLEYLNLMPDEVLMVDSVTILNTNIIRDDQLLKLLKETVDGYPTFIGNS